SLHAKLVRMKLLPGADRRGGAYAEYPVEATAALYERILALKESKVRLDQIPEDAEYLALCREWWPERETTEGRGPSEPAIAPETLFPGLLSGDPKSAGARGFDDERLSRVQLREAAKRMGVPTQRLLGRTEPEIDAIICGRVVDLLAGLGVRENANGEKVRERLFLVARDYLDERSQKACAAPAVKSWAAEIKSDPSLIFYNIGEFDVGEENDWKNAERAYYRRATQLMALDVLVAVQKAPFREGTSNDPFSVDGRYSEAIRGAVQFCVEQAIPAPGIDEVRSQPTDSLKFDGVQFVLSAMALGRAWPELFRPSAAYLLAGLYRFATARRRIDSEGTLGILDFMSGVLLAPETGERSGEATEPAVPLVALYLLEADFVARADERERGAATNGDTEGVTQVRASGKRKKDGRNGEAAKNWSLREVLAHATEADLGEVNKLLGDVTSVRDDERTRGRLEKEILTCGGHTVGNVIRGGEGVSYGELVRDVAEKLRVDCGDVRRECDIEDRIVRHVLKSALEKMSDSQREDLARRIGEETGDRSITPQVLTSLAMGGAAMSGFTVYMAATSALGAVSGALGLTLPFAFYTTLNTAISTVLGPGGWALLGAWTIATIGRPNYRKVIPVVIKLAEIRLRHIEGRA
ncbi:MAG: hypothetical protein K8I02_10135, partial [Candidatus Methylomirabilis sp.]|nr:hypothetical protein [Deltaproteobacteria bacterium]